MTDPIGDMLTRIRNAIQAKKDQVDIPASKIKVEIARILKDEGFISRFEVLTKVGKKIIRIVLKTRRNGKNAITLLKRVSTPGKRVYVKRQEIPAPLSGYGVAMLSTPRGILTDNEARRQKIGGELLCYVW